MKIYVGNLASDVTEETLSATFGQYGEAFTRVLRDHETGKSRGFAFVEIEEDSEAEAAIQSLHGVDLNGREMVVTEAPRDMGTVLLARPLSAKAAAAGAQLLERGAAGEGRTIALHDGVTTMGRALHNQVVVDEPGVSRQHASILRDAAEYWITDLGSRNGTFVNGELLGGEPRRLGDFDRIQLGGTNTPVHWMFMESEGTVSAPAAPPKAP